MLGINLPAPAGSVMGYGWLDNPPIDIVRWFSQLQASSELTSGSFQRLAMGDIAGPTSLNRDARKKDGGAVVRAAVPFPMWGSIHWW